MIEKGTIKEYSEKYKISIQAVYQAIKDCRLKKYKKDGKVAVDLNDDLTKKRENENSIPLPALSPTSSSQGIADLVTEERKSRIDKNRAEIAFKQQKLHQEKEKDRKELLEQVAESYINNFQPLKNELTKLNLSENQVDTLLVVIDACTKNFIADLKNFDKVKAEVEVDEK